MVLELMKKYKEAILYIAFGAITTLVNIGVYGVCYESLGCSNVVSNIIAWILAVVVAFITNKLWVFESKSMEVKVVLYEAVTFFGCRAMTGLLDLFVMFVTVDCMGLNGILMKLTSNLIVIVTNYVASKTIIFKK